MRQGHRNRINAGTTDAACIASCGGVGSSYDCHSIAKGVMCKAMNRHVTFLQLVAKCAVKLHSRDANVV